MSKPFLQHYSALCSRQGQQDPAKHNSAFKLHLVNAGMFRLHALLAPLSSLHVRSAQKSVWNSVPRAQKALVREQDAGHGA